jgi:hypothetical protein
LHSILSLSIPSITILSHWTILSSSSSSWSLLCSIFITSHLSNSLAQYSFLAFANLVRKAKHHQIISPTQSKIDLSFIIFLSSLFCTWISPYYLSLFNLVYLSLSVLFPSKFKPSCGMLSSYSSIISLKNLSFKIV